MYFGTNFTDVICQTNACNKSVRSRSIMLCLPGPQYDRASAALPHKATHKSQGTAIRSQACAPLSGKYATCVHVRMVEDLTQWRTVQGHIAAGAVASHSRLLHPLVPPTGVRPAVQKHGALSRSPFVCECCLRRRSLHHHLLAR